MLSSLAALLLPASHARAASENDDMWLTGAFGFSYLATYVVLDQAPIAKHVAALGIHPNAGFRYMSGGGTINDALLSDSADVAPVGAPLLVYLWEAEILSGGEGGDPVHQPAQAAGGGDLPAV